MNADATPRDASRACGLPRLESGMLWQHVLNVSRTWLVAHDDEPVPPDAMARFQALAARRLAGEPMAYLLGEREFMGHVFQVTPAVLIPRPDTEVLVETALACLRDRQAPRVVDLGTGSGAIAISIALARPDAQVIATDASAEALAVARANAERLGARVQFLQGDWYDALPAGERYALIVSNPPYIAREDEHLTQGDLRFEPPGALTDFGSGLTALEALAAGAPDRLLPGASIWLEHGWTQAADVRHLLTQANLRDAASVRDLAGIERISGACL